ncbi:pentapeptide repeat-containing protein [Aliarcobacter butzleri]|uniref:pentapeptide repeat-containing protein n=1 Tax=Aliarcobacter butzleri TaxID=28197 RepID=UPI00263C26DD|nr:pentapeptide repeat-containing protein [Aliarcobacter butzleri]MDN5090987.1 pentapeptide repeat-containing protein [Aliarcobacter butzleri]
MNERKCKSFFELIKELHKKIITNFGERAFIFGMSFIIMFCMVSLIKYYNILEADSYLDNLMVEVGGFLFDILLFGLIIGWYEHTRVKKDKIDRYQEEIEDYRGWKEKEAGYRIFGNIKRLYKLGITNFNLKNCYFKDVIFRLEGTQGINFNESYIGGSIFNKCELNYCDFSFILDKTPTNFEDFIYTKDTKFFNSQMINTKFNNNTYLNFDFHESNLSKSEFIGSSFINCKFYKCNLEDAKIINSSFKNCTFDNHPKSQTKVIVENCYFDEKSDKPSCLNYLLNT